MPTSSQALILQTRPGSLSPIPAPRYCWGEDTDDKQTDDPHLPPTPYKQWPPLQPALPPSNHGEQLYRHDQVTSGQLQSLTQPTVANIKYALDNNQKHTKSRKKAKARTKHFGWPILEYRVDFSSLPQLLKVRGLHGSLGYNKSYDAVSWKVNSIGPFYDRVGGTAVSPSREVYNKASVMVRIQGPRELDDPDKTPRFLYTHTSDYRGSVSSIAANSDLLKRNLLYAHYKHVKDQDYNAPSDNNSVTFFKLVHCDSDPITGQVKYRLQVCSPGEPGSFQLTSVGSNDVGDFRLLPQSTTYNTSPSKIRICRASPNENSYILLQQDPHQPKEFRPIPENSELLSSFFKQPSNARTLHQVGSVKRAWDVHIPRHEQSHHSPTFHGNYPDSELFREHQDMENVVWDSDSSLYDHANKNMFQQNGENVSKGTQSTFPPSDQVTMHVTTQTADSPDIYSPGRPSPIGRFGVPLKPHHATSAANEEYMKHLSNESPEVYNKLVSLGFRKAKPKDKASIHGEQKSKSEKTSVGKTSSNAWGGHDFDRWSRTTELPAMKAGALSGNQTDTEILNRKKSVGGHDFLCSDWRTDRFQHRPSITNNMDPSYMAGENVPLSARRKRPKQRRTYLKRLGGQTQSGPRGQQECKPSLIDEIKLKADYQMWKKKITAVRMRKELPPEDKCALVVRLADNAVSHDRLKTMIEKENDLKLKSLQFDPVSVHSIEAKSQWILRFNETSVCNRLIISGVNIGGVCLPVRRFNDVMKEEQDAFKFNEIMKQMKSMKTRKTKKPKKSMESQTSSESK